MKSAYQKGKRMPKIVRNPRIRDNIRLVDYKQYFRAGSDRQTELMEWYERGDLLVLTNYRFDAGREFLSKIIFPNGTKKLMLHTADIDHGEGPREREWNEVYRLLKFDGISTITPQRDQKCYRKALGRAR
jgi:hypothetical protein